MLFQLNEWNLRSCTNLRINSWYFIFSCCSTSNSQKWKTYFWTDRFYMKKKIWIITEVKHECHIVSRHTLMIHAILDGWKQMKSVVTRYRLVSCIRGCLKPFSSWNGHWRKGQVAMQRRVWTMFFRYMNIKIEYISQFWNPRFNKGK